MPRKKQGRARKRRPTRKQLIKDNTRQLKEVEKIRKMLDVAPEEAKELKEIAPAIPVMNEVLQSAGIQADPFDDVEILHKFNRYQGNDDYQYGTDEDDDTGEIVEATYYTDEEDSFERLECFDKEKVKDTLNTVLNTGIGVFKSFVGQAKGKKKKDRSKTEQQILDAEAKVRQDVVKDTSKGLGFDVNNIFLYVAGILVVYLLFFKKK